VRAVLILLLTALVAAGCGSGASRRVSSGAACAPLIEFQDREYLGEAVHGAAPQLAGAAGTAVVPGCNDVVPATTTESSTTVEAYKLAGIPRERALALADQPDVVYVARGICADQSMPADLLACLRRD
jgi:Family of unknown function (DUF6281)